MLFKEMIPGLGDKYGIVIEVISKPKEEYASEAYCKLGLPVAPAIMVGEELLVERSAVPLEEVEAAIEKELRATPEH